MYTETLSLCSLCSLLVGTSLLQEVVYLVSQGADPDEIGLMNIDEQLPVLEYPQPGLDIIQVQYCNCGSKEGFWCVDSFSQQEPASSHVSHINKVLLCHNEKVSATGTVNSKCRGEQKTPP